MVLTDGRGRASFPSLRSGAYYLKAEAPWFSTVEQPGVVVAGDVQTIRFLLSEAIICMVDGSHAKPHSARAEIGTLSAMIAFSAYEWADETTQGARAAVEDGLRACLAGHDVEVTAEVGDVFDARIGRKRRKLFPWRHAAGGNGAYLSRPGTPTELFTCVGDLEALATALPVYAARFFGVESCSTNELVERWPECYRMSVDQLGIYEPVDIADRVEERSPGETR